MPHILAATNRRYHGETGMGLNIAFHSEEARLDITIEDNLDLTQTRQILQAQGYIDDQLMTCVIDCTQVGRVFDSGKALMLMLFERLSQFRVKLIIIGEISWLSLPDTCQRPCVLDR
jgi:ABC-type transporter Mla MlaB component